MTAKEYLSQYRWLNATINSKIEQAQRMRELATAISPSSGFGSPGDISDKVGKAVAKLVDAEEEINADIDRLVELKNDIEEVISKVNDETCRRLLILRYVDCKTFEKIAVEMHYSYMQVCRIHGKALNSVKNVIECYTQSVI